MFVCTWVWGVALLVGGSALAQTPPKATTPVAAMVEALRLAAPKTNNPNDGLYSDWQVKPETLQGWSKQCLGRTLTPTQFDRSPVTARGIVSCVVQSELNQQLRATRNNETQAVRNVACWWMTGQYNGCTSGPTASYVQQVTRSYQQLRAKAPQR